MNTTQGNNPTRPGRANKIAFRLPRIFAVSAVLGIACAAGAATAASAAAATPAVQLTAKTTAAERISAQGHADEGSQRGHIGGGHDDDGGDCNGGLIVLLCN
ncbi:hypothetical protein GCM10022403_077130 [Streptomyces coacervatus]|uniref:Lipoprotein n=1 Tax=Streptomyces coacervatus TaxID=647381 RepID=A0ABP7J1W8_9ACTN|nr:hypothetical protein [Streptomyces coacervatus]MDF2272705.1 hypothetical protein [Streptomyces coacervatus]